MFATIIITILFCLAFFLILGLSVKVNEREEHATKTDARLKNLESILCNEDGRYKLEARVEKLEQKGQNLN